MTSHGLSYLEATIQWVYSPMTLTWGILLFFFANPAFGFEAWEHIVPSALTNTLHVIGPVLTSIFTLSALKMAYQTYNRVTTNLDGLGEHTADRPLANYLHEFYGSDWFSTPMETSDTIRNFVETTLSTRFGTMLSPKNPSPELLLGITHRTLLLNRELFRVLDHMELLSEDLNLAKEHIARIREALPENIPRDTKDPAVQISDIVNWISQAQEDVTMNDLKQRIRDLEDQLEDLDSHMDDQERAGLNMQINTLERQKADVLARLAKLESDKRMFDEDNNDKWAARCKDLEARLALAEAYKPKSRATSRTRGHKPSASSASVGTPAWLPTWATPEFFADPDNAPFLTKAPSATSDPLINLAQALSGLKIGGSSNVKTYVAPAFTDCFSGNKCDYPQWKRRALAWAQANKDTIPEAIQGHNWLNNLLSGNINYVVSKMPVKGANGLAAVKKIFDAMDTLYEDLGYAERQYEAFLAIRQRGSTPFTDFFIDFQAASTMCEPEPSEKEFHRQFLRAIKPSLKNLLMRKARMEFRELKDYSVDELAADCSFFEGTCVDESPCATSSCKPDSARNDPCPSGKGDDCTCQGNTKKGKCAECGFLNGGHMSTCSHVNLLELGNVYVMETSTHSLPIVRSSPEHMAHVRIADNETFSNIIKALKAIKAVGDPAGTSRLTWCQKRGICHECLQIINQRAFDNWVLAEDIANPNASAASTPHPSRHNTP